MNGDGYKQILMEYLIPFAKNMFGNEAILHQDNASTHRAFQCADLLRDSSLLSIKAPAYSADLNPIEVSIKLLLFYFFVWINLFEFIHK